MGTLASDLLYALNPVCFASDIMNIRPDAWQERVLTSQSPRLLMNCARQVGKSQVAAILAAHTALYSPASLTLVISPSERQSRELFRKVAECFDRLSIRPQMPEDNKLSCVLANKSRIVSLPGTEKTIRGFSAVDLLLADEAARIPDELYAAIRPMLMVSRGRLIALSTPFGKRGWFFESWQNGGDSWERVRVTAFECPRITRERLEEERTSMPPLFFASEYMCEFVDTQDQVFQYEYVQAAISADVQPLMLEAII